MFKNKPNVNVTSYREKYMWICEMKYVKGRMWLPTSEMFLLHAKNFSYWYMFHISGAAVKLAIIKSQSSRCRHRKEAGCSTGRRFKEEPGMFKHIQTDQTADIHSAQPVRMNRIYIDCIKVYQLEFTHRLPLLRVCDSGGHVVFLRATTGCTGVMHMDSSWDAPEHRLFPDTGQCHHVSPSQSNEGRRAGEAQQRDPPAVEEEALRPHRGRAASAPLQSTQRRDDPGAELQGQGSSLCAHGNGRLRWVQARPGVLHGRPDFWEGDWLSVRAGKHSVERRDRSGAGALQEPAGCPNGTEQAPVLGTPGQRPGECDALNRYWNTCFCLSRGNTATWKQPYRIKFPSNVPLNAPFGYIVYLNGYHLAYYLVKHILLRLFVS